MSAGRNRWFNFAGILLGQEIILRVVGEMQDGQGLQPLLLSVLSFAIVKHGFCDPACNVR